MSKFFLLTLILFGFSSCVVSKKKYIALEQELTQIKSDLKDDDKDGIPNYVDIEPKTDSLANVDSKGRTVKIIKVVDIDSDGVLDVDDFCPTIKGISAANGCPDKDGDGVYDFVDKCPNAAGLKKDMGCPPPDPKAPRFDGPLSLVNFGFLTKTDKFDSITKVTINPYMDKLFENYKIWEDSITSIEIYGHTDNSLDSLKSIKLSIKRAEKISKLFQKKGFPKSKIAVIGKGSDWPKISNNVKNGTINNRVEVIFIFKLE